MTCPPALVHDLPERLRRWVHTVFQAASVMPEPLGRRGLLSGRERIQCVRLCREA